MIKKLPIVFFLFLSYVSISQETYVPDDNFENYLETHDANGNTVSVGSTESLGNGIEDDNYADATKVETVTDLDISSSMITDLTGISDFTALKTLDCASNTITSLDMSSNTKLSSLDCSNNTLTNLNLTNVSEDFLALDTRNNSDLTCIRVDDASFDLGATSNTDNHTSFNEYCDETYVPDANFEHYLETHDRSGNEVELGSYESLGNRIANDNIVFTSSINYELTQTLTIENLGISDLTGIEDFGFLETLNCASNTLTSLDVTENLNLANLFCSNNQLTSLSFANSGSYDTIDCSNNLLTSLDMTGGVMDDLRDFDATNNPGLTCIRVVDVPAAIGNFTNIDAQTLYSENCEYTYIPDDSFEAYFSTITLSDGITPVDDIPDDNYVPTANIVELTALSLRGHSPAITDLTGIKSFTALKTLDLFLHNLSSLDVSQNRELQNVWLNSNAGISSLDFTNNTKLKTVDLQGVWDLEELLFSDSTVVTFLDVRATKLTAIDLTVHPNLSNFNAEGASLLTEINTIGITPGTINAINCSSLECILVDDVAEAVAGSGTYANWTVDDTSVYCGLTYVPNDLFEYYLETHDADGNSADIGGATSLGNGVLDDDYVINKRIQNVENLAIFRRNIDDFTGIEEFVNLKEFRLITNTSSVALDLTSNTKLESIRFDYMDIESIDVTGLDQLTELYLNDCDLDALDVSTNIALESLNVSNNNLEDLDVTTNVELLELKLQRNNVAKIDISTLTKLEEFEAPFNELTELNVEHNTALESLSISSNSISELDVSGLENLAILYAYNLNISSLDLSNNSDLTRVSCSSNASLTYLNLKNGNNANLNPSDFDISDNASLTCVTVDDVDYANGILTTKDSQTIYSTFCSETYVPDDIFENYLETHDIDGNVVAVGDTNSLGNGIADDDYVGKESIEAVTILRIFNQDIADYTGLEVFKNLLEFNITTNAVSDLELDFRSNTKLEEIRCSRVDIKNINITGLTQLTDLYLYDCDLNTLDISTNIALDYMVVSYNNLETLDVSNNVELSNLQFSDNNIEEIDISTLTKLKDFDCSFNQISNLNFENNLVLESLSIGSNLIDDIDVSMLPNLDRLSAYRLNIVALDVSNNPNLLDITCIENTSLTYLNLKNGNNDLITDMDARYNPSLTCIEVDDPTAAYLTASYWDKDDIASYSEYCRFTYVPDDNFEYYLETHKENSGGTTLGNDDSLGNGVMDDYVPTEKIENVTSLWAHNQDISDFSGIEDFKALETLRINGNPVNAPLDLSNNINLNQIFCMEMGLTELNLSGLSKLSELYVTDNDLESLVIEDNTIIEGIDIENNNISELDVTNSPNITWLNYVNNNIETIDLSQNASLTILTCSGNGIESINIDNNTAIQILEIGNNPIESIDVSSLTALVSLDINTTAISDIDISNNLNISSLICNNASITNLDVSNNTSMSTLKVNDNAITGLDVSALTRLRTLECQNNQLTFLNLKNGNNDDMEVVNIRGNASLVCAEVDSPTATYISTWEVDDTSVITSVCESTYVPDDNFETYLESNGLGNGVLGDDYVLTSKIREIVDLDISSQGIEEATGIEDFSNLEILNVSLNDIEDLDLSGNTSIKELYCYRGGATKSLNLSDMTSLEKLDCYQNTFTSINLTNATALEEIQAYHTAFLDLDVSTNTALKKLYAYECPLSTINLDGANALEELYLYRNNVAGINVSNNTALTTLHSYEGALTTLNTNGATALKDAQIHRNVNLVTVDLSTNTALETVNISECELLTNINIKNGNNSNITSFDASDNESLRCIEVDDVTADFSLWSKDDTAVFNEDCTAPVIILIGDNPQEIELGAGYSELGATVDDSNDIVINSSDFIDAIGSYTIRYNATDAFGNMAVEVTRIVNVVDTTSPVITLLGDNPQTIELGAGYSELGATVDDGGDIVINSSDFIDAIGSYTIRYNATDASGNMAVEVIRTVNVVDTTAPVITLIGDNPQEIELGSGYTELGATTDDGSNVIIDISDFVDAVGSYTIRYNATDASNNAAVEVTRIVNVIDTTAPVITLLGDNPQTIELGAGYTELGATTDDGSNVIIDISDFVDVVGSYTILYNATDASNNAAVEITRTVNVVDTTAPVITLLGDNPQTIELGDGYTELGATTDDSSNVIIEISDFVDAVGSYTVIYNATDASNNAAVEVTRIVNVVDTTAPVITLTGDNPQTIELGDGYTELGATTDDGSNVVIDISDFVDAVGSYTILYNATDASGNIAVEVSRTVTVVPVLGIEDTILSAVRIYPNPMKNWFMISGLIQKADVELFNINGQRVMVISEYVSGKISTDRIEAGIYFARITSENVVKTVRLIKT